MEKEGIGRRRHFDRGGHPDVISSIASKASIYGAFETAKWHAKNFL